MAYRQYTKCVSAKNHIGTAAAQIIIGAAIAAFPLLFGASLVPALFMVALGAIIAYCRWWLYDRLICLGGDRCAVGMLLTVEPPDKKSGLDRFDTDYSINLVLAPHRVGDTQATIENDGIQGELIKKQSDIDLYKLPWKGETAKQWANYPDTAVLHCEFEGAGVYDLLLACLAALGFATAATIACSIPIIGWIACAILEAIAAAITLGGIIVALNDTGNPNDVDSNLGELHVNDPTGRGADLLVVKGAWVYDSAHEGWNELHPIKHCQRIGTWGGGWTVDAKIWADHWCKAIAKAADPLTIDNQAQPENRWTVHPIIDGCQPEDHKPPIIK